MKKENYSTFLPTSQELEQELLRIKEKKQNSLAQQITMVILVSVAIIALLGTLFLPLMRIQGGSMYPTLSNGDVIVVLKNAEPQRGDIYVFYSGSRVLCKRIIGFPGDVIEIDDAGNVFINDEPLAEPYLVEKSLGTCEITFPYTVPENCYFAMGDNRSTSQDSRSLQVGSVPADQLVGKVVLRVWPLDDFGILA